MSGEVLFWAAGEYRLIYSLYETIWPPLHERGVPVWFLTNRESVGLECCEAGACCIVDPDLDCLAGEAKKFPGATLVISNFNVTQRFPDYPGPLVQTFHGVIEKAWTYQHPDLGEYDLILSPGPYATRRLEHFGFGARVVEVGFPKLDRLIRGDFDREEILAGEGLDGERPVFLYCPTHSWASTEEEMLEILQGLEQRGNVDIIVKLHDGSALRDAYAEAFQGARHVRVSSSSTNTPLMAAADGLITDVSSSALEFLVTGRPIVQLGFGRAGAAIRGNCRGGLEAVIRPDLGPEVTDPAELGAVLNDVLARDAHGDRRRQAAELVFGTHLDGRAGERAAEAILRLREG